MPNERRDDRSLNRDEILKREERIGEMRESGEMRDLDIARGRPGRSPADISERSGPGEEPGRPDVGEAQKRGSKGEMRGGPERNQGGVVRPEDGGMNEDQDVGGGSESTP